LPAPDSPTHERAPAGLTAQHRHAVTRARRHRDHVQQRVDLAHPGFEGVELAVVEQVGLAQHDQGRRPGVPDLGAGAVEPARLQGAIGTEDHGHHVDVGGQELLAGLWVAAAKQRTPLEHADDHLAALDRNPVADRERAHVAAHGQVDHALVGGHQRQGTVVAGDAPGPGVGVGVRREQGRPAVVPTVGAQRGIHRWERSGDGSPRCRGVG
jgi:hypothetical protein